MGSIVYLTVFLALLMLVFLARFYLLKRELQQVNRQLAELKDQKTEKKLDLAFFDRDLEELTYQINQQIDLTKQAEIRKMRTENELKQAIADMSHDIRTPLTAILGYIQLLESDKLSDAERYEYMTTVKNGAGRLKDLLDDFFELSVIEAPDYPVRVEKINLNQLISEVILGFYEEFQQRKIEPEVDLEEMQVVLYADASAVRRVMENLLLNSIKYSSGNVAIYLEQRGDSIRLVIRNPVAQLNENEVPFLFDRFYKVDKTRAGRGAGLGLAIARSLMEKMGGALHAEWKDNKLSVICEWKTL